MRFLRARFALIRVDRSAHDFPANQRSMRAAWRAADAGHCRGGRHFPGKIAIPDPEPLGPDRRGIAALHAARVDHAIVLVELGQSDALAVHGYRACKRTRQSASLRGTKSMRGSIAHEAGIEPSSEDLEHYCMASADLGTDDRAVAGLLQEHDDVARVAGQGCQRKFPFAGRAR